MTIFQNMSTKNGSINIQERSERVSIENEKSTITVDENELIVYAKKIEKNSIEDKNFAAKVDDFISGNLPPNEVLRLGTTPNCLRITGADAIPLIITQSVLANSMENINASKTASKKHSEQHDIQIEIIKNLPKLMRNPIMINKGSHPDTVVIISEAKNKEGHNIVIPMILNVKGQNGRVNRITTIHGKNNLESYLCKIIANNSIIAVNKAKADKLFSDIGIQSSQSTPIICFDNSISYSMKNVKMPEKELHKNVEQNKPSLFSRSAQKIFMTKAQAQNSEKVAIEEHKKEENLFFLLMLDGIFLKLLIKLLVL